MDLIELLLSPYTEIPKEFDKNDARIFRYFNKALNIMRRRKRVEENMTCKVQPCAEIVTPLKQDSISTCTLSSTSTSEGSSDDSSDSIVCQHPLQATTKTGEGSDHDPHSCTLLPPQSPLTIRRTSPGVFHPTASEVRYLPYS